MSFKINSAWRNSLLIHSAILIGFLFLILRPSTDNSPWEFQVVEMPLETPAFSVSGPIPKVEKPQKIPQKRSVYGLSKNSLTSDEPDAPRLKQGNTLAKDFDTQKLKDSDADLPIPADEISVTQMPQVLSEVRIPYPIEAKKNNITGSVVFDILIDQTGTIRQIKLLQGLGYGCDEAATEALKKFRFRPAKMGTESVAVRIRYAYRFILD